MYQVILHQLYNQHFQAKNHEKRRFSRNEIYLLPRLSLSEAELIIFETVFNIVFMAAAFFHFGNQFILMLKHTEIHSKGLLNRNHISTFSWNIGLNSFELLTRRGKFEVFEAIFSYGQSCLAVLHIP